MHALRHATGCDMLWRCFFVSDTLGIGSYATQLSQVSLKLESQISILEPFSGATASLYIYIYVYSILFVVRTVVANPVGSLALFWIDPNWLIWVLMVASPKIIHILHLRWTWTGPYGTYRTGLETQIIFLGCAKDSAQNICWVLL